MTSKVVLPDSVKRSNAGDSVSEGMTGERCCVVGNDQEKEECWDESSSGQV